MGVSYAIRPDSGLSGDDVLKMQLSLVSTQQLTSNDIRGDVLFNVFATYWITTSGMTISNLNGYQPLQMKLSGEESIYMHVDSVGSADEYNAILYMNV